MITLRPYQQAAKEAVYHHLRNRDDNPCVVVPTAGGKTPLMASICKDAVVQWDGRVLILAHVKELLEQTADKLRAVCPEVDFGIYSAGLNRRDTEHSVIVAGIQSVYRKACELDAFDLVIVDECCPAGTLVATPLGDIPIEEIVAGNVVRNALGVGEVLATSARPASDLVTLEFEDGTQLTCTRRHPIFTDRGWTGAGAVAVGSQAYSGEDLQAMWESVSTLEQNTSRWSGEIHAREVLETSKVLLDLLLEEAQQPDEGFVDAKKGQFAVARARPSAENSRGQWSAFSPVATSAARLFGRELDSGICRTNQVEAERRLANALQTRHCESGNSGRDRNRRTLPLFTGEEASRPSQDALPCGKRVVRVSHHERTSAEVVYNLHVAGHPSYFANGVLVHNCHLIPFEGDGMYRQFLAESTVVNPNVRVIGFTATPFRLKSGPICMPGGILNHVCFEVGVRELIRDGFLCPLVTKAGRSKADTNDLHVRGGEFVADEVEALMDQADLVRAACSEIVEQTVERKSCLIFASGIKHAEHIVQALEGLGVECGFVCGETPSKERDEVLGRFRRGELKYLCNVNVLTTGFDAPNIDCVALLRPTMSPGLYYQMVGRGFRLHPNKTNCLVLDFGGNVVRHGPVDAIEISTVDRGEGKTPAKECPECNALVAAGYSKCPECGFEFPPPLRTEHDAKASQAGILSGQVTDTQYDVQEIKYSVHTKRGAPEGSPRTMRVDYRLGLTRWQSEFVCLEHQGFALDKATVWWRRRTHELAPESVDEAVEIAGAGGLLEPSKITVRSITGEKYDRIVAYALEPLPEPTYDLSTVPF